MALERRTTDNLHRFVTIARERFTISRGEGNFGIYMAAIRSPGALPRPGWVMVRLRFIPLARLNQAKPGYRRLRTKRIRAFGLPKFLTDCGERLDERHFRGCSAASSNRCGRFCKCQIAELNFGNGCDLESRPFFSGPFAFFENRLLGRFRGNVSVLLSTSSQLIRWNHVRQRLSETLGICESQRDIAYVRFCRNLFQASDVLSRF